MAAIPVTAVSVSGRLPDENTAGAPYIVSAAQRLAAEYRCALTVRMDGGSFEVRFSRSTVEPAGETVVAS